MLNKLGGWVLRAVGPDKYDNQFYPLSRLVSAAVLGRSVPLFLGRKAVQVAPFATASPPPPLSSAARRGAHAVTEACAQEATKDLPDPLVVPREKEPPLPFPLVLSGHAASLTPY